MAEEVVLQVGIHGMEDLEAQDPLVREVVPDNPHLGRESCYVGLDRIDQQEVPFGGSSEAWLVLLQPLHSPTHLLGLAVRPVVPVDPVGIEICGLVGKNFASGLRLGVPVHCHCRSLDSVAQRQLLRQDA